MNERVSLPYYASPMLYFHTVCSAHGFYRAALHGQRNPGPLSERLRSKPESSNTDRLCATLPRSEGSLRALLRGRLASSALRRVHERDEGQDPAQQAAGRVLGGDERS